MARWEPNARERLVVAALDLFAEHGYDATAVTQIAERAGLTKTTFFRHFRDKREVLFAGQEAHAQLLADGVAAAPADATPLAAVAGALDAATASFRPFQRDFGPRLLTVIAGTSELRERAAFKHAELVSAMARALRDRGVPEPTAGLAAEIGVRAFDSAYARWVDPAAEQTLPELARQALAELRAALTSLS
ncbi:TetR/AcrR family transcriptional regulator [Kutzneria sp. CA-103260]|uniref:TetR/AcrR family transcriptional regulator n=1 Tax=Kutzneria sp. CA-103260 TaxID=2802641 RepID=UPI001BA909AC|nr:TetR/AcrR family transcriptional regulator [Kutzneria sp. CA-103260]QUQ62698.1 TetR family transcriptional regulator [Kutzneria sp. CA-103260]